MSEALLIPVVVVGLWFIISFFMSIIIKITLSVINKATKGDLQNNNL